MTVTSLFDDLKPGSTTVALASDEELKTEGARHLNAVEWTAASSALLPELATLLDVPLPAVLIRFWQKSDEIAAAIERSRHAPDDTIDVSLADATTEATFEPYIEVRIGGVSPGKKLPVHVVLPLTFKAVVLRVRNGAIAGAQAGRCEIAGSIGLGRLTVARLRDPVRVDLASIVLAVDRSV